MYCLYKHTCTHTHRGEKNTQIMAMSVHKVTNMSLSGFYLHYIPQMSWCPCRWRTGVSTTGRLTLCHWTTSQCGPPLQVRNPTSVKVTVLFTQDWGAVVVKLSGREVKTCVQMLFGILPHYIEELIQFYTKSISRNYDQHRDFEAPCIQYVIYTFMHK